MKIKTTKKMRLDELLKNVWDGNLPAKIYASDRFTEIVNVKQNGVDFSELKFGEIHKNTTYTVEVEEELTEETVINGLAEVFYDPLVDGINVEFYADCIKDIKQDAMETYSVAIFYKDTLVWTKEHGIPESGVLEVEG